MASEVGATATVPKTIDDLFGPNYQDIFSKNRATDPDITARLEEVAKILNDMVVSPPETEEGAIKYVNLLVHVGLAAECDGGPPTPMYQHIADAREIYQNNNNSEETDAYKAKLKEIDDFLTANPTIIDQAWEFKVTPLHEAACSGLKELVKLLLKHNPNTTLLNEFGEAAEARCRSMGFDPIGDLIMQYNEAKATPQIKATVQKA